MLKSGIFNCYIISCLYKSRIVAKITNSEHFQYLRAIWIKQLAASSGAIIAQSSANTRIRAGANSEKTVWPIKLKQLKEHLFKTSSMSMSNRF